MRGMIPPAGKTGKTDRTGTRFVWTSWEKLVTFFTKL